MNSDTVTVQPTQESLRVRPSWVPVDTDRSLSRNSGSLALPDRTFLRVTGTSQTAAIRQLHFPGVFEVSMRATSASLVEWDGRFFYCIHLF